MGSGVDLLKLLEPVVRPGGLPGPKGAGAGSGPIETRSFESLLSEASGADSSDTDTGAGGSEAVQGIGAKPQAAVNPLQALSQLDRIENSSLRNLMGGE